MMRRWMGKRLAQLAIGVLVWIAAACPAFAEELSQRFWLEQSYVNAPDARVYFYALKEDGTSYSPDEVALAGLELSLNDSAVDVLSVGRASEEGTTYLYVLDTTMTQEHFDLAKQAVYYTARSLDPGDQMVVYAAGSSVQRVSGQNDTFERLREKLNWVNCVEGQPVLAQGITRAGSYVSDNFEDLNPRKVLFLFTEESHLLTDGEMMAALKKTEELGVLGFSVYGYAFGGNSMFLNILQWMSGYEEGLLTPVTDETLLDAYKARLEELEQALVVNSIVDKGLVDYTRKTFTLEVSSLGIRAEIPVMMSHQLDSPAIRSVQLLDRETLQIHFNEAVNGAGSTKAYILKDELGHRVKVHEVSVDRDENGAVLHIENVYDGQYTIALRSGSITDKSLSANRCSTESLSFAVDVGHARDFGYYIRVLRAEILLIVVGAAIYGALLLRDRRRNRRRETVAQAEAYLSDGEAEDFADGPDKPRPRGPEAHGEEKRLQSMPVTLYVSLNRSVTSRVEAVILSSYFLGSARGLCDLRIDDAQVSGQHCVLSVEEDGLYVQDLDSRYGTWLNGRKITEPVYVPAGALLKIGGTSIRVQYEPVTEPAGGSHEAEEM